MIWILFILAGLALYRRSMNLGYVYDDLAVLHEGPVTEGNWRAVLQGNRAVTDVTFALTYKWSPEKWRLRVLHATNSIIHSINGCLVFYILSALGFNLWSTMIGAVLFLIHPLAVSSIANIAGRSSALGGLFVFLSVLSLLHGWWFLLPLLVWCGFRSKSDSIMLVPLIAAIAAIMGLWWWFIPLLMAAAFVWWKWPILRHMLNNTQNIRTGWTPIMPRVEFTKAFLVGSWALIPKWLLGVGMNMSPDVRGTTWKKAILCGIATLIVASMLVTVPFAIKLAILLLLIGPYASYIALPMTDVVMDNRAYTLLLPLAIVIGSMVSLLPSAILGVFAVWLIYLITISVWRASQYGPFQLYRMGLEEDLTTKPMIQLNYASELIHIKRYDQAYEMIGLALKREPNAYHAWACLGSIFAAMQNGPMMLASYRRGAHRAPKLDTAWLVLSKAYEGQARYARALCAMRKARDCSFNLANKLPNANWAVYDARLNEMRARFKAEGVI